MNDQKQNNTKELLESLKQLVHATDRRKIQLDEMNSQLRSIRHACNFVVVAIALYFMAYLWQLVEFYASIYATPLE